MIDCNNKISLFLWLYNTDSHELLHNLPGSWLTVNHLKDQMMDFDMLCVTQSIVAHMMKKRNLIFHHLWLSTQASEMGCKGSMSF